MSGRRHILDSISSCAIASEADIKDLAVSRRWQHLFLHAR